MISKPGIWMRAVRRAPLFFRTNRGKRQRRVIHKMSTGSLLAIRTLPHPEDGCIAKNKFLRSLIIKGARRPRKQPAEAGVNETSTRLPNHSDHRELFQ